MKSRNADTRKIKKTGDPTDAGAWHQQALPRRAADQSQQALLSVARGRASYKGAQGVLRKVKKPMYGRGSGY